MLGQLHMNKNAKKASVIIGREQVIQMRGFQMIIVSLGKSSDFECVKYVFQLIKDHILFVKSFKNTFNKFLKGKSFRKMLILTQYKIIKS